MLRRGLVLDNVGGGDVELCRDHGTVEAGRVDVLVCVQPERIVLWPARLEVRRRLGLVVVVTGGAYKFSFGCARSSE